MTRAETVRERLDAALAGAPVRWPVYAVYDWFVENRPIDWERLFALGLGRINHANVIRHEHPGFERVETTTEQDGRVRRDVRLVTDVGELHEWYLGEWRQEHFIKRPDDYRVMLRALEDVRVFPDDAAFHRSEAAVGDGGITVGQVQGLGSGRTPPMVVQIDWAGLQRFSLDLASQEPALMELLEVMTAITLDEIREAAKTSARQIKLWENLSIETLGPRHFRTHLVPLYRQIIDILDAAGKRLLVHYDGQLRAIAEDIAELDIDGIDSFTEAPEGDMTVAEARTAWPDTFLWLHPNLGWYERGEEELRRQVRRVCAEAGPTRYCLMISEEVPPKWQATVPAVLDELEALSTQRSHA
ncbi:MAG: uroporphyrinogen decarboxylase family protein [Armatimonadota bacterium]|nr:uroporphyrinogen decarboxylase family protein [Armatimonadota bacterium]